MTFNPSIRVAVLITGTYREIEFLLRLFDHLAGPVEHDIFVVLRHVGDRESSRLGPLEKDFEIASVAPFSNKKVFLCELPSIDPAEMAARYLVPVGPASEERERAQLSMFNGVFAAISMMKSSMRHYSHVMKTRTDYLPWVTPWLAGMLDAYEQSGRKIVVDGLMTRPRRYPERPDIPWQGSLSEVFCFASIDQFLALWDIEEILPKIWTGVAETTLFRAAMVRLVGDDLQSQRRNETLLRKHFVWEPNDTKEPFHVLRAGVLTDDVKREILFLAESGRLDAGLTHRLVRASYDFISGSAAEAELKQLLDQPPLAAHAETYMRLCQEAVVQCRLR